MNKIQIVFKLLEDTCKFEPSQLQVGTDRIWIKPYGNRIDFQQIEIAFGAANLFHLLLTMKALPPKLELLDLD